MSTNKDTTKDKNINISSLKQDFKNLRHNLAHKYRSTLQQKLVQIFFGTRSLSFWK